MVLARRRMSLGPCDPACPSKNDERVSLAVSGDALVRKNAAATIKVALVKAMINQYIAGCAAAQNFCATVRAVPLAVVGKLGLKVVPDRVNAHGAPSDSVRKAGAIASKRQIDGRVIALSGVARHQSRGGAKRC